MVKVITSKDNQRVKYAVSLKDKKTSKKEGKFLAETFKTLEMALASNLVKEVFSLEKLDLPEDIIQNVVKEDILKKISYSLNPEVVFICEEVNLTPKKKDKLIYLDSISDPGNMGTIIRTALAFNYDAIILSPNCVSIYNDKVISATKGAIFNMPIIYDDLINYKDYQIIVSSLSDKSIELDRCEVKDKLVLVLGNESHGVGEKIYNLATDVVKIPIKNMESLNVSVAGGILMYYFK